MWKYAERLNYIKRSRVDEHNIYIETNDRLTTLFEPFDNDSVDEAHYDAACYIDLGHLFADAYLSKTLNGYTYNKLEIDGPSSLTLHLGEDYVLKTPTTYLNDVIVNAKISYFSNPTIIWL
ncbi:hypothetical protein [uncultured Methanobrevibacter sp.]|uniref:hypothetical protein n=1 Tax=uncultured Methanobrevibacter sp. TaxID=253161 RepID=UPI0026144D5E